MSELPRTLKVATVWPLLGVLPFLGVQGWQRQQQATRFVAAGGVPTVDLR